MWFIKWWQRFLWKRIRSILSYFIYENQSSFISGRSTMDKHSCAPGNDSLIQKVERSQRLYDSQTWSRKGVWSPGMELCHGYVIGSRHSIWALTTYIPLYILCFSLCELEQGNHLTNSILTWPSTGGSIVVISICVVLGLKVGGQNYGCNGWWIMDSFWFWERLGVINCPIYALWMTLFWW